MTVLLWLTVGMVTYANIEIKGSNSFKYVGSIFMNSGKCKEESLNRIEQAMKATGAQNSLIWNKCVLVNEYFIQW